MDIREKRKRFPLESGRMWLRVEPFKKRNDLGRQKEPCKESKKPQRSMLPEASRTKLFSDRRDGSKNTRLTRGALCVWGHFPLQGNVMHSEY